MSDIFVYRRPRTTPTHKLPTARRSPPKTVKEQVEEEPAVEIVQPENTGESLQAPMAPRILPIPLKSPPPVQTNLEETRLPPYYDSDLTSPVSATSSRGFSIDSSSASAQSPDRDTKEVLASKINPRRAQGRFNSFDRTRVSAPPRPPAITTAKPDRHQTKDGHVSQQLEPEGINPLLKRGSADLIYFDLRLPEEHARKRGRPLTASELRQPAFYPPSDSMTVVITIRDVPDWPIYVCASNGFTYVTIQNILFSLYDSLRQQDCTKAWNRDKTRSSTREKITGAYNRRCEVERRLGRQAGGLIRCDWLGSKTCFAGFQRAPHSTRNPQRWVMETTSVP